MINYLNNFKKSKNKKHKNHRVNSSLQIKKN